MRIKVYTPEPTSIAAAKTIQSAFEARLHEPVDVVVRPCAKCPRAIIVIDGALASTVAP